jgi:REP element-mobilizing transposase RayT
MARSIRIEYPGARYHVMARRNRRERIFRDDDDRRFFLKTLAQACEMTGWRVHARVLMGNHYHLLIQTPEPNLVAGMKRLQARVIRQSTTVSISWLAEHLAMRSAANASQQILRKPEPKKSLPKPLKTWIDLSRNVAWCAREAGVNAGERPAGAIRRFSTEDRANCVAARRGGEQARNRTDRSQ